MNRMDIFPGLRSGRFAALVALAVLGLLFSASGAKAAGCALPYKSGAALPIPFVSPHGENNQEGNDSNGPASIVGLWHLNYTAKTETGAPIFPQFLSRSSNPLRPGTRMELNSKTRLCRQRAETSATASGRT